MGAAQQDSRGGPAVVVPGNHDGVHLGHRSLIQQAGALAQAEGIGVRVLTFDPHPAALLAPERAPTPLTTPERRVQLLLGCGANEVQVQPFTREFAGQDPAAFIEWLQRAGARAVVVGADFRFGKGRAGNVEILRQLCSTANIALTIAQEVQVAGQRVSSSAIRREVAAGAVSHASEMLGRVHDVSGLVIEGDRRGRQLGFPTANLDPEPVLLPADGVYSVVARVLDADQGTDQPLVEGVANIGQRPTFAAGRALEVHLFDWDDDIYGKRLRVGFVDRVRDEAKFPSVDALKAQIQVDCDRARGTFGDAAREMWAWI